MTKPGFQVVAAVAWLAMAAACDATGELARESASGSEPSSTAGSASSDAIDPNRVLADLSKEYPGFAGYSFDDPSGTLNIHSSDRNIDAEGVRAAIVKLLAGAGEELRSAPLQVLPATFDYQELHASYEEIEGAIFPHPDWVRFVYSDIDELNNRVELAFEDDASRAWAVGRIAALGVPPDAVVVVISPPVRNDVGGD